MLILRGGSDDNSGAISAPFQSLRNALGVVSRRVEEGALSDKTLLRGGVYKVNESLEDGSLYRLNLRGTPDDYAVLSAMPAEPHAPGADWWRLAKQGVNETPINRLPGLAN